MTAVKIDTTPIPDDREPLFELDGVEYTIPKHFPASLALDYIDRARRMPEPLVAAWLLEEVAGSDAYNALRECKTLRVADLRAIQEVVRRNVFGEQEEEGKG